MSDAVTTMSTGGLDRIYDAVEATIPGVLHSMVQLVVWDSLEEFCSRSTYWRELLEWTMGVGVTQIDLNPIDANMRVQWVLNVCGLGHCYRIKPTSILIDTGPGQITPADTVRTGTAWVICKPSKLSADLPAWVDDWSEGLRDGALYRLYMQPSKPYSDKAAAQFHGKRYRTQIQLARVEAKKLCECDAPRFPYFARGRGQSYGWGGPANCGVGGAGVINVGGGGGGIIPPNNGPGLTISPGVISDLDPTTPPVTVTPALTLSPGVISDAPTSGAAYTLSATSLSFPAEPPATASPEETITITNTGTVPLVITAASATGDFALTGLTVP